MSVNESIKALLVDDCTLFRQGVAAMLSLEESIQVIGEIENNTTRILALASSQTPDVVLLDIMMPLTKMKVLISQIFEISPSSKIVMLTAHDNPRLVRTFLALGASAYLVKDVTREELVSALHAVSQTDRCHLAVSRSTVHELEGRTKQLISERELDILLLVARGMSNRQIASALHLSEGTVTRHIANIHSKFGVCSRAEATRKALLRGWITLQDLV